MEGPSIVVIVCIIVFTLSKMGRYFKILSRRVSWHDSSFKSLTLAYLLTVDSKETRIIGNLFRDSSDSVEGAKNGQVLSICFN